MISRLLPLSVERRVGSHVPRPLGVLSGLITVALAMTAACEKVPLLAPTGSTITLTAAATTLPLNGTTDLIAQVLEAGGTPPQNGTLITFTTTLGTIEPSEARTQGGRVIVRFLAGATSGEASIVASSGGATVAAASAVKIKIGTAAAETIRLTASPSSFPAGGGTVTLTASVFDASGNRLTGVPIVFSADVGQLSAISAITDQNGDAKVTLTASRSAKVSAAAGSKTIDLTVGVNQGPSVTLSSSSTNPIVGQAVSFTVAVAAPGGMANPSASPIRAVTLDFGDGVQIPLGTATGNTTVLHTYNRAGTYVATATVTDINGDVGTASTAIVVGRAPAPTVIVSVTTPAPLHIQTPITISITGTIPTGALPNTGIRELSLDFGDGSTPFIFGSVASGQAVTTQHNFSTPGQYILTARIVDTEGNVGQTSIAIILGP